MKAAAAAYTQFKMMHPDASKYDIAAWADSAMDVNTGIGLWETPPTDMVRPSPANVFPHGNPNLPFLGSQTARRFAFAIPSPDVRASLQIHPRLGSS